MATQNQIALVTSGNREIGFEIAQGLLAQNFQVIITSRTLTDDQQVANRLFSL